MKTYIIGHQKPDTDSVVATIALSFLYSKNHPQYKNPTPAICDPLNPETIFVFNKFNATTPQQISAKDIKEDDKVVLVDHNEQHQRLKGINPDQIISIIDHHKPNINFAHQLSLTFRPWGSTCTIIAHLMKLNNVTPDKKLATLMLTAILSDTLGFKSPTTKQKDKKIGKHLAQIANIKNLDRLTLEIFKAKSSVSKLTPDQMVVNDFKIFDFGKKVFINQIETVDQDEILARKAELLKAMDKIKQKENTDLAFTAITDILKVNTLLLCLQDQDQKLAKKAFGGQVKDNILDIGPILSRKKQIAPAIEKALKN